MKVRTPRQTSILGNTRLPELHHPHDAIWIKQKLIGLPDELIDDVLNQYSGIYEHKGRSEANSLLRSLPIQGQTFNKKHKKLAYQAHMLMVLYNLDYAAKWAEKQGATIPPFGKKNAKLDYQPIGELEPPNPSEIQRELSADYYRSKAAKRLCDAEWWELQLHTIASRKAEAKRHQRGDICKGKAAYVSEEAKEQFIQDQEAQEAWKKNCFLVSDEGDEISLDVSEHEHSVTA